MKYLYEGGFQVEVEDQYFWSDEWTAMEASGELLRELAVEPVMTDSTVFQLKKIVAGGLPYFPSPSPIYGENKQK